MPKVKNKIIIITSVILGLVLITGICYFFKINHNVTIDRGPVFTAVLNTLGKGGPVKEDLIKRGLFTFPKGSGVTGQVKFGEIEKLVNEKVYMIDENDYLQFGPAYNNTPNPEPYFPVQKEVAKTVLLALLPGELVLDNGYLRVRDVLIIWPYGYSLKTEGKNMWVIDDKGQQLYKVGDTVRIGGGEIPASSVEEIIGQSLPPGCKGPYWLAAGK